MASSLHIFLWSALHAFLADAAGSWPHRHRGISRGFNKWPPKWAKEAYAKMFLQSHTKDWINARPELPVMPELENVCKGMTYLSLTTVEIEDPVTGDKVVTRGYNGSIPGPTVRLYPGCLWELTVVNELDPPNPNCTVTNAAASQPEFTNGSFCYLNTTNIHTHGLHVSSQAPSDDIFMRQEPQSSMYWRFQLPTNHMGGTHWYHPHLHHATASQAGGGAAGALIVEDLPGAVPAYVEGMIEKVMVFVAVDFQLQASLERMGMGGLWQTDSEANIMLVNGVSQPKITAKASTWYRLRMIFSGTEQMLQMTNKGTAWCATKLLAKDGIWLDIIPRDLREDFSKKGIPIQLGPANRADIALSCVCPFPWLGCYTEFYSLQNCTEEEVSTRASDEQVDFYSEVHAMEAEGFDMSFLGPYGPPPGYEPCQPIVNGTTSMRRRRGCEGIPQTPVIETWGPLEPPKCGWGRTGRGDKVNGPGLGSPKEDSFYGEKMHKLGHGLLDIFNGTIFSIVIPPTRNPFTKFWHPAWKFSVRKPCYLVDTRLATVNPSNQRHVEFYGAVFPEPALMLPGGPIAGLWNILGPEIPPNEGDIPPAGGIKFLDPDFNSTLPEKAPHPYGDPLPINDIAEWLVGGLAFHPFHLHVTPYQIINITGTQDGWLQDGDWQDTLLSVSSNCADSMDCPLSREQISPPNAPFPGYAGMGTVRFWTDQFVGKYISHCHLLTHEDEGMMFYVNVTGTPASYAPQARTLDPSCYDGYLDDAKPRWSWYWQVHPWEWVKKPDASLMQKRRRLRKARRHIPGADEADESALLQDSMRRPGGEDLDLEGEVDSDDAKDVRTVVDEL